MDPLKQIEELNNRVSALEKSSALNPQKSDPSTSSFLQDFIALPYITVVPTGTPHTYGYQKLVVTAGSTFIYAYTPSGWLRTKLT